MCYYEVSVGLCFFCKRKTAYEVRISDWSSDVCSSDLFAAAKQARPEIPEALGRGDFAPLMGWLAGQVHAQASSAGFEEIVERATGRPLAPAVFKAHLKARYLS